MAELIENSLRCNSCLKNKSKLLKCSNCKKGGARYCGVKCQKDDWQIHKLFCNITNISEEPTNKSKSITALFFQEDRKEPVFVHLDLLGEDNDGGNHLNISKFLIPGHDQETFQDVRSEEFPPPHIFKCWEECDPHIGLLHIKNDGNDQVPFQEIRSEEFPSHIFNDEDEYEQPCSFSLIYIKNASSLPSLSENKSIHNLLKGKAKGMCCGVNEALGRELMEKNHWKKILNKCVKWKGNVLIVRTDRYKKLGLERPTYESLDMKDIPDVALFLWILSNRFKDWFN
mmetsp:Transcript_21219/g.24112  ORF Transcript_21219/g.24112 Transcript_21219/m.24112 type:complete len:285 (-) Transcript_21219:124-978(-)